jgi:Secretion system C-terminal sorting domain/Lamin Tail Domain
VQNLVINEFSARPSSHVDAQGHHDDWIELFNAGTTPVDLNGLFVTDTIGNKLKDRLDANGQPWLLQPGAYQILWADTSTLVGPDHLSFRLSASAEAVGLFQLTNGDTVQLDFFVYGNQLAGFSSARIPNATGPYVFTSKITPGAANQEPAPITGLVLNEFSASEDWIELFNKGTELIELTGLFITDDPLDKQKHLLFKGGGLPWTLAPGGYELLWADNLPNNGYDHLSFGLSSAGDEIAMYQLIGGNHNELFLQSYTAQTPLYSMARMPNGTGPFVFNSNMTPKAENTGIITSVDPFAERQILYPNPANTEFKILLKEQNASLSIHDQFGRSVQSHSYTLANEQSINVSGLANGFYYVRIVYPTETVTIPLIIAH